MEAQVGERLHHVDISHFNYLPRKSIILIIPCIKIGMNFPYLGLCVLCKGQRPFNNSNNKKCTTRHEKSFFEMVVLLFKTASRFKFQYKFLHVSKIVSFYTVEIVVFSQQRCYLFTDIGRLIITKYCLRSRFK